MAARYDLHIHTKYLGCANQTMEVPAIIDRCAELGVTCLAITDHVNRPEQLELHRPILRDLRRLKTDIPVYFGLELNFTGLDGDLVFSPQIKADYGFQFAIGGIHNTYVQQYDREKIIEIQHRHHLAICRNELVDVLVHPYWFSDGDVRTLGFTDFESVAVVPRAMVRELGRVARETDTVIEINAGANLAGRSEAYVQAYFDYLKRLADEGVRFAICSDAHDINQLQRVRLAWDMADRLGLSDEQLWRPAGRPIVGG